MKVIIPIKEKMLENLKFEKFREELVQLLTEYNLDATIDFEKNILNIKNKEQINPAISFININQKLSNWHKRLKTELFQIKSRMSSQINCSIDEEIINTLKVLREIKKNII